MGTRQENGKDRPVGILARKNGSVMSSPRNLVHPAVHPVQQSTQRVGVPEYPWWNQVPAHLKTRTQLSEAGLKPGGPVRAHIAYGRGRRARCYELYDQGEAVAKKRVTEAQARALEKAHHARRTCQRCQTVVERPGLLVTASDLRHDWEVWEVLSGAGDVEGWCWCCVARAQAAFHDGNRDEQIRWARELLARPSDSWCVLDTETTGLDEASVVEVAVVGPDGTAVFEALVNPGKPIPAEASAIHGICDEDIKEAPTFEQIMPHLQEAIRGRVVVVYNLGFDKGVLRGEVETLFAQDDPAPAQPDDLYQQPVQEQVRCNDANQAWRDRLRERSDEWLKTAAGWRCAMIRYAAFTGNWSHYHREYRRQRLDGGHRAAGDCRAVLSLLREMAATPLSTEPQAQNRESAA